MSAVPPSWRIVLNPKLWDLEGYMRDWSPEAPPLAQSKGNCRMASVPEKGDGVVFVCKGRVVMRGTVLSDGFVEGAVHQEANPYNRGSLRLHTATPAFAWIRVEEVGLESPYPPSGQRTWAKYRPVPVASS
jgi:hypothetical protein